MKQLTKRPLIVFRLGTMEHRIAMGYLMKDKDSLRYEVHEPILTGEMKAAYYDALYYIQNRLTENHLRKNLKESYLLIKNLMQNALKNKSYSFSTSDELKIIYYLYRDLIGLGIIEALFSEPNITYISCEGLGKPIYAYHKEYGFLETNIVFKNRKRLGSLIWRMLKKCVKTDTKGIKGLMKDGSFIETDYDFNFQLRKSNVKFTPQFLIKNKMATPAAFAYLESLMKHNKSIMIVGPKGSGKTTFFSGLLHMMEPSKILKIIEHEPNLIIDNMNWSSKVIRSKDPREIIDNYLKSKPDYLILDEMTGNNAKFILNSLSFSPGIISFEAGNTDVAINRITDRFKVPKSFLANIDVIIMLSHNRNIEEILEIQRYDKEKNEIKAKVVFRKENEKLKPLESRFMRTLDSSKIKEMKKTAKKLHSLSKK